MALDQDIVDLIRDEIGPDEDVGDDATSPGPLGDLETIYTDANRGNSNVLRTALIVWRRRLGAHFNSAFDISASGSLLSRSQKTKYIERNIKRLEILVDTTQKGSNVRLQSEFQQFDDAGAEF